MLTVWKAIILGVVQGATEFLPISSSGHLVVIQQLFGWMDEGHVILAFDVALHIGTLFSVIAVFWRDVLDILSGRNLKLLLYLVIATIPAVIIGFLFKEFFENLFVSTSGVAVSWIITGLFLMTTRWEKIYNTKPFNSLRSFIVGCAQAAAIIPGISRSGSTIVTGILLGVDKIKAARFAFLMSVPAILGAAILGSKDISRFPKEFVLPLVIGVISSAVVGYICIRWLLKIIRGGKLWYFGIYCLVAGALLLAFHII